MGIDLESLIETVGYIGLFLIVFAETGLLVGFFLPGDTLLITAGLVASQGKLDIWILIPVLLVAAIAEVVEFFIVKRLNARYGGSDRAFWGAIAGGVIGAVVTT